MGNRHGDHPLSKEMPEADGGHPGQVFVVSWLGGRIMTTPTDHPADAAGHNEQGISLMTTGNLLEAASALAEAMLKP